MDQYVWCMLSMLRLGESNLLVHPVDDDSADRFNLCLQVYTALQDPTFGRGDEVRPRGDKRSAPISRRQSQFRVSG